jgi:hypothetical protein
MSLAMLQSIYVPVHFAASMLGKWDGCAAKLALGSQRPVTAYVPLPGGAAAAKGTLAHRVIEQWTRGNGEPDPGAVFAAEYARLRDELRGDPARAQFADLAEVLGAAEWSGFRAWVLRRCQNKDEGAGKQPSMKSGPPKGAMTGVEVPLSSAALRLRGRADRIRRLDANTYEIRDYKSGAVLGENGAVKDSIVLQLQAYGLMFLESEPLARLLLVVDIGKELPVAFDEAAREQARMKIERLISSLPTAGNRPMHEIAKPGADCLGCRVRHVCQAYLRQAPAWWVAYPGDGGRIANDSWGVATAVNDGTDGIDVTLMDASGRRVRIDRLDRRHGITASAAGGQLWFFDLEGSGPDRDFKGQRYHPRVFHELPRDRRERRAWGMQCFIGVQAA